MKINIIIVDIARHEYSGRCLGSIYDAAKQNCQSLEDDIEIIYITEKKIEHESTKNYKLSNIVIDRQGEFNKSYYLNRGIEHSTKADVIGIIDIDMLVSPDYFKALKSSLAKSNFIIANGYKLAFRTNVCIYERIHSIADKNWFIKRNKGDYPSQIIFDKKCLYLFRKILKREDIYDERLFGWGGEDCLITRMAWKLHKNKLINLEIIDNLWYHLFHKDNKRNSHRPFYQKICAEIDRLFNEFLHNRRI